MKRDNHFVPRVYLRQWSSSPERVWVHRLLVSSDKVPLWRECWIKGLAKHEHLYTSVATGEESDVIETWLDTEFESPAAEAIRRATSNQKLDADDWCRLVRFLAAQDVRTPARLAEHLSRWSELMPALLQKTVDDAVERQERSIRLGLRLPVIEQEIESRLPVTVTTHIEPGASQGHLKAEVVVGRETWLFGMRRLLSVTLEVLQQHRWTVLRAAPGKAWITSDNPVIKLNYYRPGHYDFGGGWGSPGTEIMLPLGPHHLLYTQVGKKPPQRGTILSPQRTDEVRFIIAAHAHRMILGQFPDPDISVLRQRRVDALAVSAERDMWANWHTLQSDAVGTTKGSFSAQQVGVAVGRAGLVPENSTLTPDSQGQPR